MLHRFLLAVVIAILLCSVAARLNAIADPSSARAQPRRDLYGDPLPAGAIARLGSVRFRLDSGDASGVGFSRDGRYVIGATQTALYWWHADTGRVHRRIELGEQWIQKLRQSSDRKTLATISLRRDRLRANSQFVVETWDVATGKRMSRFEFAYAGLADMQFSSDGTRLLIASRSAVQVWNLSGTEKLEFNVGRLGISCLATLGDRVAVGAYRAFEIRDWKTGKLIAGYKEDNLYLETMTYTPDGKSLVVASGKSGQALAVHDAATGKLLKTLSPPDYHNYIHQMTFAPDGKRLAVAGYDRRGVEIWDVTTGKRKQEFSLAPHSANSVAFSPDGKRLAAAGHGATAHVWDLDTGTDLGTRRPGHRSAPQLIAFVLGGKSVATGGDDGEIRIWDPLTGRQRQVLRHGDVPKDRFNSVTSWIRALAVSPDGKLLGTSSMDDTVRIWDAATGKERLRLFGHGRLGGQRKLAFTADGKRLVSWGEGKYLRVWGVRTGRALREHALKDGLDDDDPMTARRDFNIAEGLLSPDGTTLLQRSGGNLAVMDVETAKIRGKLPLRANSWGNNAISPDGKLLLACEPGPPVRILAGRGVDTQSAGYHFVRLLRIPDGKEVLSRKRPGFGGPVAFSADGKRFAIASTKRGEPISICDTATGKELRRIPFVSRAWSLAFSPDGKLLVAGLADSTSLVWDLSLIPRWKAAPPKGAMP